MATERSQLFYEHTANLLTGTEFIIEQAKAEQEKTSGSNYFVELEGLDGAMVGAAVVEHKGMRFTVLDRTSKLAWIGKVETPVSVSRTVEMQPRIPFYDQWADRGYFPLLSGDFAEVSPDNFYCSVVSSGIYTELRPPNDLRSNNPSLRAIDFDSHREQRKPIESVGTSLSFSPLITDALPLMLDEFHEDSVEAEILERFFMGCAEGSLKQLTQQDLPLGWRYRLSLEYSPIHTRALGRRALER